MQRRQFQNQPLEERLAEEAKRLRAEAKLLPPGARRENLIRRGSPSRDRLSHQRVAFIARA
jgi:hypothetical protein